MMKKKVIILLLFVILFIAIVILMLQNKSKDNQSDDTLPYLLGDDCQIIEQDTKKGMTIKDKYENEWVWIVVPKTKVFQNAKNSTDYENIEKDIQEYIKDYSSKDYNDTNTEEKELKEKTLSSIYQYGGFWISRYEVGTDNLRNEKEALITEPLSQPNKYVYNYVTFEQAKEISSKISNSEYTSNLLFGFQWDLVCKMIEENGYTINEEKITKEMINSNSSLWGNYYSSSFIINRGKYSINYGETYNEIIQEETKKSYKNALLTTGASEQNKACNIYDFAGNVSEWVLEYANSNDSLNTIRDGSFYFNYGGNDPVNGRYSISTDSSDSGYGFRITCIK